MGKVSFMSIVKEYIEEKGLNDDPKVDAYLRKSYRYLEDFIEKLGGNIDDMKSANHRIEFDESEIPSIKYLLRQFLASDKNTIKNFINSKDNNYSVDEINKFIDQFTNEYCTPEDKCAKVYLVEYMSNIFMLSHMRLIEECHALIDLYACNLQYLPRSLKLVNLQAFEDEISHLFALQLVGLARQIEDISRYIELCKDDEEDIDCIYDNLPVSVQSEYVQRDQEILKAIQEDDDLRRYIEKKIGKKAEDIFNYKALTHFALIYDKADTTDDNNNID